MINSLKKFFLGLPKNCDTHKTKVKHIDLLDMIDFGKKNNSSSGHFWVVNDNFSEYGWYIALTNKTAQALSNESSEIVHK